MSKGLKEILIGILLGDASIRRSGINKASISFAQSGQKKDYFNQVYNSIQKENLPLNEPNLRNFVDPRYPNKVYSAISFSSKPSEDLRPIADLFLDANGKKIVPSNISDLLTPKSLAYWIMDDGQHVNRGGVTLCTDNFKHEDIVKLQEVLKSKYNLKTTIHVKKGVANTYERIYISKNEAFESLKPSISEHMEKSMLYKLNMGDKPWLKTPMENEINSPTNTRAGTILTVSVPEPVELDDIELDDIELDDIIGDTIDSMSTLEIVNELLQEFVK